MIVYLAVALAFAPLGALAGALVAVAIHRAARGRAERGK